MSNMQIDSVLAQIRAMSSQVHGAHGKPPGLSAPNGIASVAPGRQAEPGSFASLMQQGIDQVNRTQQHATAMATAFERGAPGVELPDVMLEMQKASVSFRALTEVRNRFVNVYQEVMNMPI